MKDREHGYLPGVGDTSCSWQNVSVFNNGDGLHHKIEIHKGKIYIIL